MHCPSCHKEDTRVIDSRMIEDGIIVRRRRECEKCGFRFSTMEKIEILTMMVEKADGRLEPYVQEKVTGSLKVALQKRPISNERLQKLVHQIEQDIQSRAKKDQISTQVIGEIVMKHLKRVDKVGYIRYASVYHSFEDVSQFADELEKISRKKRTKK